MTFKHVMLVKKDDTLILFGNPQEKPKNTPEECGEYNYGTIFHQWLIGSVQIEINPTDLEKVVNLSQYNYIGNLGNLHSNWYVDIETGIELDVTAIELKPVFKAFPKKGDKTSWLGFLKSKIKKPKKEYKEQTFTLTKEQMETFEKWRAKKNKLIRKSGELPNNSYTFCFTPTGIGTNETIKCTDGTQIDLTDYDTW